ncbi:Ig-like domain (group 2) [Lachnospiraceae bacterium RM5]|nr:Ig-like domain (group 2) [Lachnospiraceae bacterium RM5]
MKKLKIRYILFVLLFMGCYISLSSVNALCDNELNAYGEAEVLELDLGDYIETMSVGEKQLLSVTVLPFDAVEQTVSYSSSNTQVATINGMGRITAISVGETTISASCGCKTNSFLLQVKENTEAEKGVTDIEILNDENKVKVGESISLNANVIPAEAVESKISYTSSNENVATVSSTGEVKGIGKGDVIITLTAGNIVKEVYLSVIVPTKKITVDNDYLVLKKGGNAQISANVLPAEANQIIKYKSLNENVATVTDAGYVSAIGEGNTTIVISNDDLSSAVTVIVNENGIETNNVVAGENINNVKTGNDVVYSEKVKVSEFPVLNSKLLKYLYDNKKNIQIDGKGYTLFIKGEDIVNYNNELNTNIKLKFNKKKGLYFDINDGKELCGKITVRLSKPKGKYLYLFNKSKGKYERLETGDLKQIQISKSGKYMISEKKQSVDTKVIIVILLSGVGIAVVLLGVYFLIKCRYIFW